MKRNLKEWNEKRAEFLKGKTRSWCSSSDSLCVNTPRAFSPAHINSEIYIAAYARFKEVYRQKYHKFDCIPTGKHRHKSHPPWHKASSVHKNEPDHTDLEEQYIEVLVDIEVLVEYFEGNNFKKRYHEWLEEAMIKYLIEEEIKNAEKECESLTNTIALCKRVILQVFVVWDSVLYAGVSISLYTTRPALIASPKKKGKTFWQDKRMVKTFRQIQARFKRTDLPTNYKSAFQVMR